MPTRHQLDHALTAANPVATGMLARAELEARLDELGAELTLQPQEPHAQRERRRRRVRLPRTARGVALAGAIGVLLAGAATAATVLLTTYTGQYNKGWEVQAGGPGENLLMGAPDFCQAALKLSSDITYPSGYESWRPWVLIAETGQPKVTTTGACGSNSPGGEGRPTLTSTGALHGWFAMSAFCAWVYDWRAAENSGDTSEVTHAALVIAGALTWPAVVAEDPHPSQSVPGDLGTTHPSLFGWFIPFQSAVASDDSAAVATLLSSDGGHSQCTLFDPPADSHSGTVNPSDHPAGPSA
jgi:hypothetical protein